MSNESIIVRASIRDLVEQWAPGRSPDDGEPDRVVEAVGDRYYEVREISRAEAISKGFKEQ